MSIRGAKKYQEIGKVFKIPAGILSRNDTPVYFYVSEDRLMWGADYHPYSTVGDLYGFGLKIDEKHSTPLWEEVRLFAIKHLLPLPQPPPPEPYHRFKDLELE